MTAAATLTQYAKMLRNLDRWLDMACDHAKAKGFDPDVLAASRLAPDQYELVRQVQAACDQAKFAAAYLSGDKAPSHPDTEKTIAELRARIATCTAYVEGIDVARLAGAAERHVKPAWLPQGWFRGDDYVEQVATPNFYFHVVTAYAILRHNGVVLGKMDFVGAVPTQEG